MGIWTYSTPLHTDIIINTFWLEESKPSWDANHVKQKWNRLANHSYHDASADHPKSISKFEVVMEPTQICSNIKSLQFFIIHTWYLQSVVYSSHEIEQFSLIPQPTGRKWRLTVRSWILNMTFQWSQNIKQNNFDSSQLTWDNLDALDALTWQTCGDFLADVFFFGENA